MGYLKRSIAAALLLGILGGVVLTNVLPEPGFLSLIARQGLVAALAGGMAEWLVVRTRYRRLPGASIPTTESQSLSPAFIAARVQAGNPAQRLGVWLRCDIHAQRAARFLVGRLPAILSAAETGALNGPVADTIYDSLGGLGLGATLQESLKVALASSQWNAFFDRGLDALLDLAFDNADRIHRAVERENFWWMPRSSDRRITNGILSAIADIVAQLRVPDGDTRLALVAEIEEMVAGFIEAGQGEGEAAITEWRVMANAFVQAWLESAWTQLREQVISLSVQDGDKGGGTDKLAVLIAGVGNALAADAEWQGHLNDLIAGSVETALSWANEFGDDPTLSAIGSVQPNSIADPAESAGTGPDGLGFRGMLIGATVGCGTFLLAQLIH